MSPHQRRRLKDDRGFANGREAPIESDEDRQSKRKERFKTSNWCKENVISVARAGYEGNPTDGCPGA
jgi:hypothetical protein